MARTITVVKGRYVRPGPAAKAGARAGRPASGARRGAAGDGARGSISNALRYIERRPLGPDETVEERQLFDGERTGIAMAKGRDLLDACATAGVTYHTLVLSPGPGAEEMDLHVWTRHVMADLEKRLGRDLVWVAAVHRHNEHPHVHVIVGASTRNAAGKRQHVRFTRDDFRTMRESGDRWATRSRDDLALLRDAERYLMGLASDVLPRIASNLSGTHSAQGHDNDDDQDDEHRRRGGHDHRR